MAIRVTHYTNACVLIETRDCKILCDPWFTEGAYQGAWYHWPKITYDPIKTIPPVDYVFISHIHPDHYDPLLLRAYLAKHPTASLLIGSKNVVMEDRLIKDGFRGFRTLNEGTHKTTIMNCIQHENGIDSALIVTHEHHQVINVNDCQQTRPFEKALDKWAWYDDVEDEFPYETWTRTLISAYQGAGPYPQCFQFAPGDAEEKQANLWYNRVEAWDEFFRPDKYIKAGDYILAGKLANRNAGRVRNEKNPGSFARYSIALSFKTMDYERGVSTHLAPGVNWKKTIAKAYSNASKQMKPTGWIIALATPVGMLEVGKGKKRIEIWTDPEYLWWLLNGKVHWNDAEIGSHCTYIRTPEKYDEELFRFLWGMHVAGK